MKAKASKNKTAKKADVVDNSWWSIIPLMLVLGIVPLVVFMKMYPLTVEALNEMRKSMNNPSLQFDMYTLSETTKYFWTGVEQVSDFFSYYKSMWLGTFSIFAMILPDCILDQISRFSSSL